MRRIGPSSGPQVRPSKPSSRESWNGIPRSNNPSSRRSCGSNSASTRPPCGATPSPSAGSPPRHRTSHPTGSKRSLSRACRTDFLPRTSCDCWPTSKGSINPARPYSGRPWEKRSPVTPLSQLMSEPESRPLDTMPRRAYAVMLRRTNDAAWRKSSLFSRGHSSASARRPAVVASGRSVTRPPPVLRSQNPEGGGSIYTTSPGRPARSSLAGNTYATKWTLFHAGQENLGVTLLLTTPAGQKGEVWRGRPRPTTPTSSPPKS